jgi:competence protein ComEC
LRLTEAFFSKWVGQWYLLALSSMVAIITVNYRVEWRFIAVFLVAYFLFIILKKNLWLPILTCFVFSLYFFIVEKNNVTQFAGNETNFQGEVLSILKKSENQTKFNFKTVQGEILVSSFKGEEMKKGNRISIGMKCTLSGNLQHPPTSRNFYDFNYKTYLYHRKIHWLLNVNSLTCHKSNSKSLITTVRNLRKNGIDKVNNYYPKEMKGFVNALLFGHKAGIEKNDQDMYRKQGLSHLIAISGLHVGTLIGLLFFLLIRFGITRERSFEVILVCIPFYIIFAGGAPSVLRSCIMAFIVILLFRFKTNINPLDAISIACLIILAFNPYELFSPGFQLSFLVSAFLILSSIKIITSFQGRFEKFLAVTLIAQLASFPLILWLNFSFSIWSLFLNVLFIPLYTIVILPLTFISYILLLCELTFLFHFSVMALSVVYSLAHDFLAFFHALNFGEILFGKPSIIVVILYYIVLIWCFYKWEKRRSWRGFFISCVPFYLLCFVNWSFHYVNPIGEVTFLDVGQGDAVLIKMPYNEQTLLIDTGGVWTNQKGTSRYNAGKSTIIPYLNAKGIKKIDKLILTHGDLDHIGGAIPIIREKDVYEIVIPSGARSDEMEKVIKVALKSNVKLTEVVRGDYWLTSNSAFTVIHPSMTFNGGGNDASIVLYAIIGGNRWLFTGDVEKKAELNLINSYSAVNVDILKVAHHGSATSTSKEFLSEFLPNIAVISAGVNNYYGHPHEKVLTNLKDHSIKTFRTDQLGAVRFRFYNKLIDIKTGKSGK